MQITKATEIGTRPYQEDYLVVAKINGQGTLLAVMDGHGGYGTAEYIAKNLETISKKEINKGEPLEALRNIFKELHEQTKSYYSGSTLSLVWLPHKNKQCFVAVLGDSPVIVKTSKELKVWVSPEHNVRSNANERKAAEARGGVYSYGYIYLPGVSHGLQFSRALGDSGLEKILSRKPEIFQFTLKRGSFIILATDGVFDPSHQSATAEIKRIVYLIETGGTAREIVADAVRRKTGDNATAIVCKI